MNPKNKTIKFIQLAKWAKFARGWITLAWLVN